MKKIIVVGGGPVGLTFAICLAEKANLLGVKPEDLQITVYELRVVDTEDPPHLQWRTIEDVCARGRVANRRREQVATLQNGTLELLEAMHADTYSAFHGEPVWPCSENVAIRDLDDALLRRARAQDVQQYVTVKRPEPEIVDAVNERAPSESSEKLREWLTGLECDLIVGADGANSTVRSCFEDQFETQRLEQKDFAVAVGFEDLPGWEPQPAALNALISYSQNRYWLQAIDAGRRGCMLMRLTQREFSEMISEAGAPETFSHPCVLFDLLRPRPSDKVPIWQVDAGLQMGVEEGLRLFGLPPSVVTTVLGLEMSPHFTSNVLAAAGERSSGKLVALIGDAAMAPHLWTNRSLDAGLRGSVALCRAVASGMLQPGGDAQAAFALFSTFMAQLRQEEIAFRSAAMLVTGEAPELPAHCDRFFDTAEVLKAVKSQDQNAEIIASRVKAWQRRLRSGDQPWAHAEVPEEAIDDRFAGMACRPLPQVLRVLVDSGREHPDEKDRHLVGAPLEAFEAVSHPGADPVKRERKSSRCASHLDTHLLCAIADLPEAQERRVAAQGVKTTRAQARQDRIQQVHESVTMSDVARQRAAELEAEEAQGQRHDEFYDLVLDVDNFSDVIGPGWTVRELEEHAGAGEDAGSSTRIVILGNFKKGKTWLMQKITGSTLPSNEVVHTPGLCSKKLTVDGKQCYILDVKGENSPLKKMDKESLMDKKAEESFLREIICDISDTFIYLVQQVGYAEQLTHWQLTDTLKTYHKPSSMVLVVHNLRHLTRMADLRLAEEEIMDLYKEMGLRRNERIVVNPKTGQREKVWFLQSDLELNPEGDVNKFQSRHFVLGAEGSEAGRMNDLVIDNLRHSIVDIALTKKEPLKQEILTAVQRRIGTYLMGKPPIQAEYITDDKGSTRLAVRTTSAEELILREMDLGNFVSVKANSSTPVPFRISETNFHVRVAIDLPGLTQDKVAEVIKVTKTIDGVRIQVKTEKRWRRLKPDERLIDGTLQQDAVDFVINVRRLLKSKKPSKKEMLNGTFTLEWELDTDDIEL